MLWIAAIALLMGYPGWAFVFAIIWLLKDD